LKTHLFALTAIFFLLATTSCQKKPTASFSTDKEVYTIGEKVLLSNASQDAYYYTWIAKGPGMEEIRSSKEDFSFMLSQVGTYEISLSVYSKNGKLVSQHSKSINSQNVKANIGRVVFYTTNTGTIYYVSQNGISLGNFEDSFTGVPQCNATGALTYQTAAGVQSFYIQKYTSVTTGIATYTVQVEDGLCKPLLVNF
jgi:hypothetical protein